MFGSGNTMKEAKQIISNMEKTKITNELLNEITDYLIMCQLIDKSGLSQKVLLKLNDQYKRPNPKTQDLFNKYTEELKGKIFRDIQFKGKLYTFLDISIDNEGNEIVWVQSKGERRMYCELWEVFDRVKDGLWIIQD